MKMGAERSTYRYEPSVSNSIRDLSFSNIGYRERARFSMRTFAPWDARNQHTRLFTCSYGFVLI